MHMLEEKREINAYAPKTKLHLFCSKFGTLFTYIGILSKSDASRESIDALDFLRDLRIGHSSPSVSADGTKLGWNGAPQKMTSGIIATRQRMRPYTRGGRLSFGASIRGESDFGTPIVPFLHPATSASGRFLQRMVEHEARNH
jgi:hypothetical protein